MTQAKAKRPTESVYEKTLPFSSDPKLREQYVNYLGDLRFGILLEEMDWAAGMIAYKHTDGFDKDLTIVTASCDRIDLLGPLPAHCDLRIQGQVNWVGRSSMETGIRLESYIDGQWVTRARAYFVMVARKDDRGYPVNPLEPVTEDEKRRHREAEDRQTARRASVRDHFLNRPPNDKESALLHQLFLKTRGKDVEDLLLMSDTHRTTTLIMHPQQRNIHHKIFGGYIMRMAFETGWTIAHIFTGRRPLFMSVDQFDFIKPVNIGSIVSMDGQVIFTGNTSFIIQVTTTVIDPKSGEDEVTNVSYFTFVAVDEHRKPTPVPAIHPYSYEDGLMYLDGARRYARTKEEIGRRGNR